MGNISNEKIIKKYKLLLFDTCIKKKYHKFGHGHIYYLNINSYAGHPSVKSYDNDGCMLYTSQ